MKDENDELSVALDKAGEQYANQLNKEVDAMLDDDSRWRPPARKKLWLPIAVVCVVVAGVVMGQLLWMVAKKYFGL